MANSEGASLRSENEFGQVERLGPAPHRLCDDKHRRCCVNAKKLRSGAPGCACGDLRAARPQRWPTFGNEPSEKRAFRVESLDDLPDCSRRPGDGRIRGHVFLDNRDGTAVSQQYGLDEQAWARRIDSQSLRDERRGSPLKSHLRATDGEHGVALGEQVLQRSEMFESRRGGGDRDHPADASPRPEEAVLLEEEKSLSDDRATDGHRVAQFAFGGQQRLGGQSAAQYGARDSVIHLNPKGNSWLRRDGEEVGCHASINSREVVILACMTTSRYPIIAVLQTRHTGYLLVMSLLGRLPTAMAPLAIVQFVRSTNEDFAFAGLITAVYVVAGAVGQPVLGNLVDRFGQVLVLSVCGVLSFLSFAGMAVALAAAPGAAVAFAAAAGFLTPPLESCLRALWPRLVSPGPRLSAAFSLDAGAQEVLFVLGPLLTVAGIAAFGPAVNVLFVGALGLVGTLAFVASRAPREASEANDLRPTARTVKNSPILLHGVSRVILFTCGLGFPIGALTIVATAFEEVHVHAGLAGWILSANAIGALVGAIVVGLRPLRSSPDRVLCVCGLLLAVGYLPLTMTDLPIWAYVVAAGIAGLMLPPTLGKVFERIAQLAPPATLTEANGWIVSAITLGIGAGTVAAGAIAASSGAVALPWIVLGASILTALCSLMLWPGSPTHADL